MLRDSLLSRESFRTQVYSLLKRIFRVGHGWPPRPARHVKDDEHGCDEVVRGMPPSRERAPAHPNDIICVHRRYAEEGLAEEASAALRSCLCLYVTRVILIQNCVLGADVKIFRSSRSGVGLGPLPYFVCSADHALEAHQGECHCQDVKFHVK